MQNILITGAAGYIGSVCTYNLLKKGYKIIAFDNLSTGRYETIEKLKKYGDIDFIKGDLKNYSDILSVFKAKIDAVIHFAAYSQVGASQLNPLKYYENNVYGSINLFKTMIENDVKKIVFSSTAAIYGNPQYRPLDELHPKNPLNTYGKTKLMIENILADLERTYGIKSAKLRYFNASGASDNLEFGEKHDPETHLIPNILNMKNLKIFGDDYQTKDGSCVRDYIDVEDLAHAHILVLNYLENNNSSIELNLGTKKGYSVFEIVNFAQDITGEKINYTVEKRRDGDPETLVADNLRAKETINWQPEISIKESIKKAYEYKKRCLE